MEVIAEINDLACHSIENDDHQLAQDVLNCCLGCVRQLKNHRTKMAEDRNGEVGDNMTKEIVTRLLKDAKRKFMKRSATAATVVSSVRDTTASAASAVTATSGKKRKTSTISTSSLACPSQESECPSSNTVTGCAISMTTQSPNNRADHNSQNHHRRQYSTQYKLQYNCNQIAEERFFVYRKPRRTTKFQWSRVAKYQNSLAPKTKGEKQEENDQCHIDREVELAVSSNLIFNIALTHHLIGWSQEQKKEASYVLSSDNDDSEDDVEMDDDNGCGYETSDSYSSSDDETASNSMQTEERLRGALRLYELGFEVHTKRVAYITAMETLMTLSGSSPSSSLSAPMHPSSSSIPTTVSPTSATTANPREGPSRLSTLRSTLQRSISSSSSTQATASSSPSSSQRIHHSDHDDELKSTTRFALALLNNCAHIHQRLGQVDKLEIFQKRLLSFLLMIVDSGESVLDVLGDDPAADGYLKNAFAGTFLDKDTAPAAAA